MLTSLHGVSQRPTRLHSVGYTIPKKYLLQVEIWFRGFSWPSGGCQESLPPHPGHKAQRGRQERSRGQNDYPCISFVPLPSASTGFPSTALVPRSSNDTALFHTLHTRRGSLTTLYPKYLFFSCFLLPVLLSFSFGSFFPFPFPMIWQSEFFKAVLFPVFLFTPNTVTIIIAHIC